jgi:hypothetical protein
MGSFRKNSVRALIASALAAFEGGAPLVRHPFSSMNSTPAFSRARRTLRSFAVVIE